MKAFATILCFVVFLAWAATRTMMAIEFDINCEDYISQAASSPNPSIAISRLDLAISYIERNNLTAGSTGIFFLYPSNDLSFWYKRLIDSRTILKDLPAGDNQLEISNTMIRVHEFLTADSKDGQSVVMPTGVSVFPNNAAFFAWGLVSFLLTVLFGALWITEDY